MRLVVVFFLIVLALVSCQRNKIKKPTIVKKTGKVEQGIGQKLNSYCFFELDDKYSIETDSLIINRWLKEKSTLLLKSDSVKNIFNQDGGGPNGSQWNPSTNLYLAILTTSNRYTEDPKLYINGKLYKRKIYEFNPYLSWYLIRQDFWEKEVKEIDSIDIKKMYLPEFLNGIKNGEFNPSEDLDYGKILRFEIFYKEEKLTKFFHATYGE